MRAPQNRRAFVVGLAPYGVFAILAHAAGTMDTGGIRGLEVHAAVVDPRVVKPHFHSLAPHIQRPLPAALKKSFPSPDRNRFKMPDNPR